MPKVQVTPTDKSCDPEIRESVKILICDLIAASGGTLEGTTRLYKAFYVAHLFYWRDTDTVLTSYPIVHMPNGPGIHRGNDLLFELVREGKIRVATENRGPYPVKIYDLSATYQLDPTSPRWRAIKKAVDWIAGKDASGVSNESHIISRSWTQAEEDRNKKGGRFGDELNIYLDTIEDMEYNRLVESLQDSEELVSAVFGS